LSTNPIVYNVRATRRWVSAHTLSRQQHCRRAWLLARNHRAKSSQYGKTHMGL